MKNSHNTRSSRSSVKNIHIIQGGQDLTVQAGLIPVVKFIVKQGLLIDQFLAGEAISHFIQKYLLVFAGRETLKW